MFMYNYIYIGISNYNPPCLDAEPPAAPLPGSPDRLAMCLVAELPSLDASKLPAVESANINTSYRAPNTPEIGGNMYKCIHH